MNNFIANLRHCAARHRNCSTTPGSEPFGAFATSISTINPSEVFWNLKCVSVYHSSDLSPAIRQPRAKPHIFPFQ